MSELWCLAFLGLGVGWWGFPKTRRGIRFCSSRAGTCHFPGGRDSGRVCQHSQCLRSGHACSFQNRGAPAGSEPRRGSRRRGRLRQAGAESNSTCPEPSWSSQGERTWRRGDARPLSHATSVALGEGQRSGTCWGAGISSPRCLQGGPRAPSWRIPSREWGRPRAHE